MKGNQMTTCPKCNHTMTTDMLYCECCGTYLAAPQPKLRVVSTSTYRFDLYGDADGSAAPAVAQETAAFYNMYEPTAQPGMGVPAPAVPYGAAPATAAAGSRKRRSRRMRMLFTVSTVTMLLLGFSSGMTAFANDDADSRLPIVVEYEELVTPEVEVTPVASLDDAEVVTILDDPTPMASSPYANDELAEYVVNVEPAPEPEAAPAPVVIASTMEEPQPEAVIEPLAPCTLEINGTRVPYIFSVFASLCPDNNAALWAGSDDTTDGSYGYFIGHNPGDFACVYSLVPGNCVTLCDQNGNLRNYTVTQLYDVPSRTAFQEMAPKVIPDGETLVMQTCIGDGSTYRIVVCQ